MLTQATMMVNQETVI